MPSSFAFSKLAKQRLYFGERHTFRTPIFAYRTIVQKFQVISTIKNVPL